MNPGAPDPPTDDLGTGDDRALNPSPLRAVVIVGLSHSGSTMLDLTLGAHPRIVGTGEIFNFGRKWLGPVLAGRKMPCSCGKDVRVCELWGPAIDRAAAQSGGPETISSMYAAIVSRFRELWPDTVLLDSSKKLQSIDLLSAQPHVDVRVLFLVRDVRGWVASSRDRGRKVGLGTSIGRRPIRTRMAFPSSPVMLARRWRSTNLHLLDEITRRGVPFRVVSYERLCFDTVATLGEIVEFAGLPTDGALSPAETGSHIVNGNIVRLDPDRRAQLTYDTRWMRRVDALLPYVALPRVRRLSDELVWSESPLRAPEPADDGPGTT